MTFPWHVPNSLTFPGFPDKWSPWTGWWQSVPRCYWWSVYPYARKKTKLRFWPLRHCEKADILRDISSVHRSSQPTPNHPSETLHVNNRTYTTTNGCNIRYKLDRNSSRRNSKIKTDIYEHVYSSKWGQPTDRQTDRRIQIKTAQAYR